MAGEALSPSPLLTVASYHPAPSLTSLCWVDGVLPIWMISSSIPRPPRNIASNARQFLRCCWLMSCSVSWRNALVAMDPQKQNAVHMGCILAPPNILKHLQCFLGFSHFYWRFIQGFSSTTAPPSVFFHLCSHRPLFGTLQTFIVEVDASDVGIKLMYVNFRKQSIL